MALTTNLRRFRRRPSELALGAAVVVVWGMGVAHLMRRWQSVHPAVFEADTYAQALRSGLLGGALAPWELSDRFWPFFLMAPGIYAHVPVFSMAGGGRTALLIQATAIGMSALLLARVAVSAGLSLRVGLGLALAWLVHPVAGGVGLAWGWSPYATAAPLILAGVGALLPWLRPRSGPCRRLQQGSPWRQWLGLGLFALAAAMKVNSAVMLAGLGAWMLLSQTPQQRSMGRVLVVGGGLWVLLTGSAFTVSAICAGTFAEDVHLGGPAPTTAGGLLTLAITLVPVLPLLSRRGWALAGMAAGIELVYTAAINPANSGLVPATAVLFAAALVSLPRLQRPGLRVALAVGLGFVAHQLYTPPRVAPLPLQAAAWSSPPDPRGGELRAWVASLPSDATLLTFDPFLGAIGGHAGPVLEPAEWDGTGQVVVLLAEPLPPDVVDCVSPLFVGSERWPTAYVGTCGRGEWATAPTYEPFEECAWTGNGSTKMLW